VNIRESIQPNKNKQPVGPPVGPVKDKPIEESFIRTMADDMSVFKKKGLPAAQIKESKIEQKKTAPPVGLPVVESVKKPVLPSLSPKSSQPSIVSKPVLSKEKPKQEIKPKVSEIKITKNRLKFLFSALAIILIMGGLGGFFYWWNYLRSVTPLAIHYQCQDYQCVSVEEEGEDQCQINGDCQLVEPTVPESLIPIAGTQTIELVVEQENLLLGQLKSVAAEEQVSNTIKRILVKLVDQQEKKYADLNTLILALRINIPENILSAAKPSENKTGNYALFSYSQTEGNRLGIVIKMRESDTLVQDLKNWEEAIVTDLRPLLLVEELSSAATEEFQDNIYQEIPIRYINLPAPDLSIDYALVGGNLVIATSRESMYAAIDALLTTEAETTTGSGAKEEI
jgi:hypothetical protein